MFRVPRAPRLTRICHGLCAAIACVVAAALWQGCTVTEENYQTLSFWFDGVPDPKGKFASVDPRTGEVRQFGKISLHKPFEEEKCAECHNGPEALTRESSSICLKCHQGVTTQHARMHGPVSAVACLWCHSPHESTYPNLMRNVDRKLCLQCHDAGGLDPSREPAHADPNASCLTCHSGHGGPKPFLLRSDAPKNPAPKADATGPQPVNPGPALKPPPGPEGGR